ncbi:MAG: hypothetical protein GX684_04850 [Ruminococcaceae bacterium]|nr:hypothetical protein [Oscillospiraceae bacterium]
MKRTNTFTILAVAILFLGMATYIGYYIYKAATRPYKTVTAIEESMDLNVQADGIVIRDEYKIVSDLPYMLPLNKSKMRVSANEPVYCASDNADNIKSAELRLQITAEIEMTEAVLSNISEEILSNEIKRDKATRDEIRNLAAAKNKGDSRAENMAALSIKLLSGSTSRDKLTENIAALEAKMELLPHISDVCTIIKSEQAGMFFTYSDGLESLSSDNLRDITPSALKELIAGSTPEHSNKTGKIVFGQRRYFATVLSGENAEKVKNAGSGLTARYGAEEIKMRLSYISSPEGGACAVILYSMDDSDALLSGRKLSLEIIYSGISGIKIPTAAINTAEDGTSFVYISHLGTAAGRNVSVLWQHGDESLVESGGGPGIKAGDIVVVGNNIKEGMPID